MLDLGLMDMTPDIDMVYRDAAGRTRLLEAARGLGLEIFGPEKRHDRLGLGRINIKGVRPGHIRPTGSPKTSDSMWLCDGEEGLFRPSEKRRLGMSPWRISSYQADYQLDQNYRRQLHLDFDEDGLRGNILEIEA